MNVDAELGETFTGLGDSVLLAWVAQARKESDDPITLYATGERAELLKILGQDTIDKPWHLHPAEECYHIDVKLKGEKARWRVVTDYLKLPPQVAQPTASVSEADKLWAKSFADASGRPFIVMFPQCNDRAREWPVAYWRDLHWKLRGRLKYPISLVRRRTEEFRDFPCLLEKLPMGKLVALLAEASLVIGNDSFGVHLAGTLGRPTLALLGPTKPSAFHHFAGLPFSCMASEKLKCTGCHAAWPYRSTCGSGCQSLYSIFTDDVFKTALKILDSHATITYAP